MSLNQRVFSVEYLQLSIIAFFKIKQIRSANHSQTLVTWADNYKIKIKEIKEKLDLI